MAVYRHRFQQSDCVVVLTSCFVKEARAWLDSNLSAVALLPNSRPIELLIMRFKKQYMGPTQIKQFRNQIMSTKLAGVGVTTKDLKQHYESFVTLINNLRMCDKFVTEEDIKSVVYRYTTN